MKKKVLISGIVFVSFLFISCDLYAQRFFGYGPGNQDDYYDLKLTQEQMEKIDKLELELEKELLPLFSKLRSNYMELDELEVQGSSDPAKIKKIEGMVYKLEDDIQNKEILYEKKIKDLLTEDQRAVFDSDYGYGLDPFGRGDFGRGYFGRGISGFRGGNYGYGGYGYNVGIGRNYLRRGAGRLGRGYYGYGRGISRGYGMNRRDFGLGAGSLSAPSNFSPYPRFRYGRGPCGAGLGRWNRMGYGRGRWNWNK
ncbi:Spy/CpxP family protein refolding chaperone [Acidobacteriota bacterium]